MSTPAQVEVVQYQSNGSMETIVIAVQYRRLNGSVETIMAYTAEQIATAKESWNFWRPLVPTDILVAAWLGNEDGETSFVARPGDNGEAEGAFQWWPGRRDIIMLNTGIDVVTAPHIEQLKAAHWEITMSKTYKHVWPIFLEQRSSLQGAITVLVRDYEQSASPQVDVKKRVAMAKYWLSVFA